jgi:hypothetical protein
MEAGFGKGMKMWPTAICVLKKANKWALVAAAIFIVMTTVACKAEPEAGSGSKGLQADNGNEGSSGATAALEHKLAEIDPAEAYVIGQTYRYDKMLYLNLLSSFYPVADFVEYYTFSKNSLTITDQDGEQSLVPARYEKSEIEPEAFIEAFGSNVPDNIIPDIKDYPIRLQYDLNRIEGQPTFFRLYIMNEHIWLARMFNDEIWSLYQLVPYSGELPVKE